MATGQSDEVGCGELIIKTNQDRFPLESSHKGEFWGAYQRCSRHPQNGVYNRLNGKRPDVESDLGSNAGSRRCWHSRRCWCSGSFKTQAWLWEMQCRTGTGNRDLQRSPSLSSESLAWRKGKFSHRQVAGGTLFQAPGEGGETLHYGSASPGFPLCGLEFWIYTICVIQELSN